MISPSEILSNKLMNWCRKCSVPIHEKNVFLILNISPFSHKLQTRALLSGLLLYKPSNMIKGRILSYCLCSLQQYTDQSQEFQIGGLPVCQKPDGTNHTLQSSCLNKMIHDTHNVTGQLIDMSNITRCTGCLTAIIRRSLR